jgi:malic enzyme
MHRYHTKTDPATGERYLPVDLRGRALMTDSMFNKGTAFTRDERNELGIQGLLPPSICTIERQLVRVYENYRRQPSDLDRYLYLVALQDRNETLFYRLLSEHVEEMTPIVYTPTVGLACERFSHIYRRPRGLYVTPDDTARMHELMSELSYSEVSVIVATDSEGILGLGDQGAGGMGIPIGKLALYTLGAGIHPARCLPVCLDVGTSNTQLRSDPLYLGLQRPRLEGDEYYTVLDAFVEAVAEAFPSILLQWEDFSRQKAWTVLERYRDRICSFNDDIQGTGAIGGGIIQVLLAALEEAGLSRTQAKARVVGLDSRGLIAADRPGLEPFKHAFAADPALVSDWRLDDSNHVTLSDVVANFQPTVLIGTSGQPGCFTEALVREMAEHVERPAIFALSNPTSKTEVLPADAIAWTDGRALVATGSPFEPVEHGTVRHRIGQGNNVFCFPGIGLGVIASRARRVTDGMLLAAARAVADEVAPRSVSAGCVYPEMEDLRPVSRAVALAVAQAGISEGVAEGGSEGSDAESIERRLDAHVWYPDYLPYRYEPDEAQ